MDIALAYEERGQGAPLIFLHGNGGDHRYFTHQLEHFSATRRCIAIDTRGYGQSPRGTATYSLSQFAEDLHDFMDEKQIEKADILGFSDGGNIALLFALRYPERVKRLILNGANLEPKGVRACYQKPIEEDYRAAVKAAETVTEAIPEMEKLGLMVNEPHIAPAELSALPFPTLVIAGTKDMIRQDHTRRIAASLPNAKLVLLPGTHFIALETPKEFNEAVEEFFRETE